MPAFCGQDRILIDANGRFKLPPRLIEDFLADGNGDVVFYYLPEGALAIYPEKIYAQMRQREADDIRLAGMSMLKRRDLRRFGAWSASAKITPQGRLTLPTEFRANSRLEPGTEAIIVGVEIGAEAENVSYNTVISIETHANELLGMQIQEASTRVYPKGTVAAHALGYTGKITAEDIEGKEEEFEKAGKERKKRVDSEKTLDDDAAFWQ